MIVKYPYGVNESALSYGQYVKNACIQRINSRPAHFPAADPSMVEAYRSSRMFFCWKRYIRHLLKNSPEIQAVYGIFDRHGNLIELEGNDALKRELSSLNIQKDTCWDLDHLGPNAVTLGLSLSQTFCTLGDENYNECLKKYAVCFVPMIMNREIPPYDTMNLGGAASFVPLTEPAPLHLTFLGAMAYDLCLDIQHSQVTNMLYERSNNGILLVDLCCEDAPLITYCSHSFFEILEIPERNVRFQNLDSLINPAHNKEFWKLLRGRKRIKEQNVNLSIEGKTISCIISTDTYNQEQPLHRAGVIFFITTQKRISSLVSARIANTAIMSFDSIIGQHPRMQKAIEKAKLLANTTSNIMLNGESGVGKDVFAQAIHNASSRSNKPFIAINCGALPRDLIASELFGYDAGAFTGAKKQGNIGKFELANGGTIFLDEIGELPLDLQATLLRLVEQKRLMRLGGTKEIDLDVKIISATNVDLSARIREKQFRADLYYRLSTLFLEIPPLRERGEDIILLAEHTARRVASRVGRTTPVVFSPETKELLAKLPWPGNVRELQNTVERIVQLYPETLITPEAVLDCVHFDAEAAKPPALQPPQILRHDSVYPDYRKENLPDSLYQDYRKNSLPDSPYQDYRKNSLPDSPYQDYRKENLPDAGIPENQGILTKDEILRALTACRGNRSEAARYLGISRKTLYRKMEAFGIPGKR